MNNKKVFYDGIERTVLMAPYSKKEIRDLRDKDNFIKGVVGVYPSDMLEKDSDDFINLLSERLVDNYCLMSVDYHIVGLGGDDEILLEVTGDVSEVLERNDEKHYVVVTYSFDADTPLFECEDYDSAVIKLKELFDEEVRVMTKENGWDIETEAEEDYAKITYNGDVTEFRITYLRHH